MRKHLKKLLDQNKAGSQGYKLVVYDLYNIMLDLIEKEDLLDSCIEMEKDEELDYLILAINDILRIDYSDNYFSTYMKKTHRDNSVVFITEVKIFPFMRVYRILNKLHLVFDRAPVVLFYPDKYDGQNLMLFLNLRMEIITERFRL